MALFASAGSFSIRSWSRNALGSELNFALTLDRRVITKSMRADENPCPSVTMRYVRNLVNMQS